MAEKVIEGRTEDAQKPFLGADFWIEGKVVQGFIQRIFQIPGQSGNCYELLTEGVELDGQLEETVNMGALKGFLMALQSLGGYELKKSDFLWIECTSIKPPTAEKVAKAKQNGTKLSPMVYFHVKVTPGRVEYDPFAEPVPAGF